VPVHAEDFLGHDHGAARRTAGRGQPGIEFMAIAGHESREFTHAMHCATRARWHSYPEWNISDDPL
jgi:hypothetical protein